MRNIKYNPDIFDDEKSALRSFFMMNDFDSYRQYYDFLYPLSIRDKELYEKEWYSLTDSTYHLMKQELEYIFRKPQDISWELLDEYSDTWNKNLKLSQIVAYLLTIYYDFYIQDEEFDKNLYESTKVYFWVNEEDIDRYRKI